MKQQTRLMQRAARLFARRAAHPVVVTLIAEIERHPVPFDTRGNAMADYARDYIVLRNPGDILAVYRVSEDGRHISHVEPEDYPDTLIGSPA